MYIQSGFSSVPRNPENNKVESISVGRRKLFSISIGSCDKALDLQIIILLDKFNDNG